MIIMVITVVLFRFHVPKSEAMMFVREKVVHSANVESKIGKVSDVHLARFGAYKVSYSYPMFGDGEDQRAFMDVEAVGSRGSMVINIEADKTDNIWKIEKAMSEGRPFTID
jgi:hypothetical protein